MLMLVPSYRTDGASHRHCECIARTQAGTDRQQTQTAPVSYSAIASLDAELRACKYDAMGTADDSQRLVTRISAAPCPHREAASGRYHPSPCRK